VELSKQFFKIEWHLGQVSRPKLPLGKLGCELLSQLLLNENDLIEMQRNIKLLHDLISMNIEHNIYIIKDDGIKPSMSTKY
jgi:hypothetical protein